jgi:hypothetical protein
VLPSLDGVEIVHLDDREGKVDSAATLPLDIDPNSRSIDNIQQLTNTIRALFEHHRIPLNSPTVLTLPSFYTRELELPTQLADDELRMTLISEAERFIAFKKNEPQVDFELLSDNRVLYTAYPRVEVDKFVNAFQELKIPLVAIDLNYTCILRGLVASGAIMDEITQGERWCLLCVADFSFFAMMLDGVNIQSILEAPLSVGAKDEYAAITEIQQDFEQFTGFDEPLGKLVLVNNSQRIQSSTLLNRLGLSGEALTIEQNASTLRSRGAGDGRFPCTLEAIGGAYFREFPDLPTLSLLPQGTENLAEVEAIQETLFKGILFCSGLALVISLMLWGVMILLVLNQEATLNGMNKQLAQYSRGMNVTGLRKKLFIQAAVDRNIQANNFLIRLGGAVPSDMWLTSLDLNFEKVNGDKIAPSLEMAGGSLKPEPVNAVFNELRKNLGWDGLSVDKLDLVTTEDGQSYYQWLIATRNAESEKGGGGGPPSNGGSGSGGQTASGPPGNGGG